jgi:hypothetical protein
MNNYRNYINISKNFIPQFYKSISESILHSKIFFNNNTKILFNNIECLGFERFNYLLISKNIYYFKSKIDNILTQPLDNNRFLITVYGKKSINGNVFYSFSDTFIITNNFNKIIINNYISHIYNFNI